MSKLFLSEKQKENLKSLLADGVHWFEALKKAAPEIIEGLTEKQCSSRFNNVILKKYPDVREVYRRSRQNRIKKSELKEIVENKKDKTPDVKNSDSVNKITESLDDNPLDLIKKRLALCESAPESTDVFNLGRGMLLLAFTEIEARRKAIIENEISPLSKEGSIFSYTIVPVIKCAVDMMLPFVRDNKSNLSDSIMAAELIKQSLDQFKENPDDYTAPIPDGVEVNDN